MYRPGAGRPGGRAMRIIGDRHYKALAGERITFSLGETTQVGDVTLAATDEPGDALPLTVTGGKHQIVSIIVGFTGDEGGSAVIEVTSSLAGGDASRIRQIATFPFRDGNFTID